MICGGKVVDLRVHPGSGSGPARKRFRLTHEKLQHTLRRFLWCILVHAFGRDCVKIVFQVLHCLITLGGVVIMLMGVLFMNMTELE